MLISDGSADVCSSDLGAGRGLGREYALLLASRGAKIVVNDIGGSMAGDGHDDGPAQDVVREIKAAGGEAVASTDSVATREGGHAIIAAALAHYGRIEVLINNDGHVRYGSLEDTSYDNFQEVGGENRRTAWREKGWQGG